MMSKLPYTDICVLSGESANECTTSATATSARYRRSSSCAGTVGSRVVTDAGLSLLQLPTELGVVKRLQHRRGGCF